MRKTLVGTFLLLALAAPAFAADGESAFDSMSLEELLSVEVFTAAKRPTSALETAAAITVLTRDDLRRNGVSTLVEALEWVPGVQFSRLNAANTAVGIRGFTGVLSDKLLVLIDGRSIYSLFYSGVYWDEHVLPIEDVERIEIIRGPGGTLWGANAVNGVVNVVTRHAEDTHGWHANAQAGPDDTDVKARLGKRLGDDVDGRVWFTAHDRSAFATAPDHYAGGGWQSVSFGSRIDARDVHGGDLLFTLNAVGMQTEREDILHDPATHRDTVAGGGTHEARSVAGLMRWERPVGETSKLALQGWFELHDRDQRTFAEYRTSYDLDAQLTWPIGRHQVVTGANLRVSQDEVQGSTTFTWLPTESTLTWSSLFFQDELRITDRLRVTAGIKVEHNDFTGLEQQPNLRVGFDSGRFGFWWGAASHAVRTPSRAYTSTTALRQLNGEISGLPIVAEFFALSDLASENLRAFELGWRKLLTDEISLDVTAFANQYDDLIYQQFGIAELRGGTTPNPYFAVPAEIVNGAKMETHGIETVVDVKPLDVLQVQISYTYLDIELSEAPWDPALHMGPGLLNNNAEDSPQHTGYARVRANPSPAWDLDLGLRFTSALDDVPAAALIQRRPVDGTRELSARIAWRPLLGTEVALVGRNLIDDGRVDFYDRTEIYPSAEVPTQIFLQLRLDR